MSFFMAASLVDSINAKMDFSWTALIFTLIGLGTPLFLIFILYVLPDGAYEEPRRLSSKENLPAVNRTHILVLGDIGRSPRMQNHAISLLERNIAVDLIGYLDSDLHPRLSGHKLLNVHAIPEIPQILRTNSKAAFLVTGPIKVLWQIWQLWMILGHRAKPARWLLLQNPPSIPTLLIASVICAYRRTRLAVDWHNFGYSILALKLGDGHPMVRVSKAYERWFSFYADVNFTVSEAMSRQILREFRIKAPVLRLYDRPTADFNPLRPEQRKDFLLSMGIPDELKGLIEKGQAKVLVSSTSWTPDEDFSILLDALVEYSRLATSSLPSLPELLVMITGKGPQKGLYLRKVKELEDEGALEMVTIKTAWLPTSDYANLLASADIGVSLHQSSSGVDLPMKVVDMFGAGLPVVGWSSFESWPELVKDCINGRDFSSAGELQDVLVELLGDDGSKLEKLRKGVLQESNHKWEDEWVAVAGKALKYIQL